MLWERLTRHGLAFWFETFVLPHAESAEHLRRSLWQGLLLVSVLAAAAAGLAALWGPSPACPGFFPLPVAIWPAVALGLVWSGRRFPVWISAAAGILFWMFFLGLAEISTPSAPGARPLFYALLVACSSFLFPAWAGFVTAGVCALWLTGPALARNLPPPVWTILGLLGAAASSWLSARLLEQTRHSLLSLNESLEWRIQARTAEFEQSTEILSHTNQELEVEIARRQVMEYELREAKEEAESANQVKTRFLANMSHEIRTPMTAIIGFAEVLKGTDLTAEQRDYLDTICHSGDLLISLINDILDISKIEANQVELEQIDFDLEYLLATLLKIMRQKVHGKPIELRVEYPDEIPRTFKGDPTRIRQILLNLLNNAVKFTQQGEVVLTVSRSASESASLLCLSVRDTGIGIPKSRQKAVFEAFVQGDGSITRRYGGTGLGLTISKQLAERMGGTLSLRSEERQGSEFLVRLPLIPGQPAPEKPIVLRRREELAGHGVLIVEDNPINQTLLEKYCRDAEMRLAGIMDSATDALVWLETYADRIDLILCDIMMPSMDGFAFAERVRARPAWKRLKLIALTSDALPGNAEKSRRTGFDAYLAKPLLRRDFLNVLQATLGDSREVKDQIVTHHLAEEIQVKHVRVLLAEDNAVNQKLLALLLEKLGCRYELANNGLEAVAAVKARPFDVVLMDIQMPEMDGYEAAEMIRKELTSTVPIIALTAHALKEDVEHCLRAGMNDYLSKPIDKEKLKAKIFSWAAR